MKSSLTKISVATQASCPLIVSSFNASYVLTLRACFSDGKESDLLDFFQPFSKPPSSSHFRFPHFLHLLLCLHIAFYPLFFQLLHYLSASLAHVVCSALILGSPVPLFSLRVVSRFILLRSSSPHCTSTLCYTSYNSPGWLFPASSCKLVTAHDILVSGPRRLEVFQ